MGLIKAEYIWIDGHKPTAKLRSKTKVFEGPVNSVNDIQEWGFDGSSTMQAEGKNSDCMFHVILSAALHCVRHKQQYDLRVFYPIPHMPFQ